MTQAGTEKFKEAGRGEVIRSLTVDSFMNGLALGQHSLPRTIDPRSHYWLRLYEVGQLVQLRSRYNLEKENPLAALEGHLARIARQGALGESAVYLGTSTDPFFPFDGKFDASMRFLELFKRYTPAHLQVQTRSPLVVIALPVLKALGQRAGCTIALESCDDQAVARYTPSYPRVEERLKAARALRRFGVEVTIQVGPVLPYGDWERDAPKFAELLDQAADYIYLRPLCTGTSKEERRIKNLPIAQKLAQDRKFHWLRPDADRPLRAAIEARCPAKLQVPERKYLTDRQLKIFAA